MVNRPEKSAVLSPVHTALLVVVRIDLTPVKTIYMTWVKRTTQGESTEKETLSNKQL